MPHYKHTQIGLMILAPLAVAMYIVAVTTDDLPNWIAVLIYGIFLVVGILFSTLTVEVEQSRIRCWFGPGLIRKQFPLSDIVDAKAVRNRWFYGWGIRLTPHGWLFNVSGLDAVEITLNSGTRFRIGTDQPRELETAIRRGAGLTA
jgi:hypothetical protein